MRNGMLIKSLSFGMASLALAAAVTANADDRKSYTGLSCQETTPPVELIYTNFSTAKNNFSGVNNVQCAVVRDNTAATMSISDWDVTVRRNSATSVWDIRLWNQTRDGSAGGFAVITVPSGSGVQNLDGGPVGAGNLDGAIVLETDLPGQAEIASYQVSEVGVTD